MSRSHLSTLGMLLLLSACADSTTTPLAAPAQGSGAISDAMHGENGNPGFFWLPPMVEQPTSALVGEPQMQASPRVVVVCQATNQLASCDAAAAIESAVTAGMFADFTLGAGLEAGDGSFQVDFDTHAFGLSASSVDGTSYTTYRVVVYTESLVDLGGPFVLGYADFQVGENGKEAKNLTTGDVIGLVDGRTLPVKFRIEKGAYAHALKDNLATGAGDPADEPLCQENCTVTFVSPEDTTTAALEDLAGLEVTAVKILPGNVSKPSVIVIDERKTEGEDADCANGVSVQKKYCYRYRITPDVEFNDSVRFGICPRDVPLDENSLWRILKVDYDAGGDPVVTRPPEVDVSDFLPCTPPTSASLVSRLFRYALDHVAPALYAQTKIRIWGGTAKDFSDLFWALDAEMTPVTTTDTAIQAGTTYPAIVRVQALYPEPDIPLDSARVTFRITGGEGWLNAPGGADVVSVDSADGHAVAFTLLTDVDGLAGVEWIVGEGSNRLMVRSPDAMTPEHRPITFTVEGKPTPQIDAIDPSTVEVPAIDMTYSTFVLEGSGFEDGSVYTNAPLVLLGEATVNADGTTISRDYQIGPGAPAGMYNMYVQTPFGLDSIAIDVMLSATNTGGISGTVTRDGSEPAADVTVTLVEASQAAITTASGGYVFSSVTPGTYTVRAALTGYATASTTVVVTAGATATADLQLFPPGKIAFYIPGVPNSAVWVIEPDGEGLHQVTDNEGDALAPSWSPDGTQIAFESGSRSTTNSIWTINADGTGLSPFTDDDAIDHSPAWSPDGQKIAFASASREPSTSLSIWVMNVDGTGLHQLTDDNGADHFVSWSPDGSQVVFQSEARDGSPTNSLWATNTDGTGLHRLTDDAGNDYAPVWSPDGSRIAFYSYMRGSSTTWSIWVMNADGTGLRQVTDDETADYNPTWSPDSRQIAFHSFYRGTSSSVGIWVINVDGSGLHQVTPDVGINYGPSWSWR